MATPSEHNDVLQERVPRNIAIRCFEPRDGWIDNHSGKTPINAYWTHQNYISLRENYDLLLCGNRAR
jgi:hypothetical protein